MTKPSNSSLTSKRWNTGSHSNLAEDMGKVVEVKDNRCKSSLKQKFKNIVKEVDVNSEFDNGEESSKIGARLAAQCSEMSDFTLSRILGPEGNWNRRPHSVMSISSTVTSSSSTDGKMTTSKLANLSFSLIPPLIRQIPV
jgi:hypothetical protein